MRYIGIFFLVVIEFFCSEVTQAQTVSKGISVTPVMQEVVLDKEQEEASFLLEVTNTTDTTLTFRLSVIDFGSLDESGGVAFLGGKEDFERKYGLASWVILEKDALALGPQEKQTVKVSIVNKESLSPGGHYGAVVFRVENSESDEEKKVNIAFNQAFSSLIFVNKRGGEKQSLYFAESDFKRNFFLLPDRLRLRFQNSGNVHVVPRGIITISDPLGRILRKGIINQESAVLLPESFRSYLVSFDQRMLPVIPGMYTLSIRYRFDGQDEFQEWSSAFMFIPFWFLVGVLGILIGVMYGVKRKLKNGKV